MAVGRGDVNGAGVGKVAVLGEDDRHLRPAAEHLGDDGLAPGVKVLDHHHRHGEAGRQAAEHAPKSRDADAAMATIPYGPPASAPADAGSLIASSWPAGARAHGKA
jgi:hypothetical protein